MNFDKLTSSQEKEPRFPALEEIRYKIKGFVEKQGLKNSREVRILAQEKDVYHYELIATDEKGDDYLYSYKRKGEYHNSQALITTIEVTYYYGSFDTNMAVGGDTLADYDENTERWTDAQ